MNLTTKDLETILYSLEGYMQGNDDNELVEELDDICYRINKKLEMEYDNNERESKFIDINNTGGKY